MEKTDVAIIGAGPSGAIAAALLVQSGHQVIVLERDQFPRFSIGESLLPQCMAYIEQANMLDAVANAGFQPKNGAAFHCDGKRSTFDFREKFTPGWGTTYQVERARFDKILADEAARQGADIRYGNRVKDVNIDSTTPSLCYTDASGQTRGLQARFLLDASGFGRVLPRLLALDRPSDFPVRQSIFTHIDDGISDPAFDRDKILISVHPKKRDIWYWLIPFQNGRASIGVVGPKNFATSTNQSTMEILQSYIAQESGLRHLLDNAHFSQQARQITGYSASVSQLYGNGFALLGNAGEFLDPVFSSGVTIGMHSAVMAAALVQRQLKGESVDWEQEFAVPLTLGVNTFRTFVSAWYDQRFQDVVFHPNKHSQVKAMISSILAGYAWDESNPYVSDTERRLNVLSQWCHTA